MKYRVLSQEQRGSMERVFFEVFEGTELLTVSYVDASQSEFDGAIQAHIRETIAHREDENIQRID